MIGRTFSIVAIVLWVITIATAAVFFIKGQTQMTADNRVAVMLAPEEREFVLAEMRMLLEGVQGITAGVAANDMQQISSSARRIGMASAADVNPQLMMKLPLAFKQQGMSVHKQFDQLADMADSGASANELLTMLSEQLSSCVACHSIYTLEANLVKN